MSSTGTSTFVIRWLNFLTMIIALFVVGFGVWMNIHHDQCRRSLTLPVIGLGAVIFLISSIGFLGAWKNVTTLLWMGSGGSRPGFGHGGGGFGGGQSMD